MDAFQPTWIYRQWDGSEEFPDLDPDALIRAAADDLLRDGDVELAMQRLFRWGAQTPDGRRIPGLRDLLERLRRQRAEAMERYDLDSVLGDIKQRLQEIVDTEESGIKQRLDDMAGAPSTTDDPDALSDDQRDRLGEMLRERLSQLADLPEGPADRFQQLQDYEFTDPRAAELMEQLRRDLQQQVSQSLFSNLQQSFGGSGGTSSGELQQLLDDLNRVMEDPNAADNVDFDALAKRWGHILGRDIKSLDDLMRNLAQRMEAARNMMASLSPSQREELSRLVDQALDQQGLREAMNRLQANLARHMQFMPPQSPGEFVGDEHLTLDMAVDVMEQMAQIDEVERSLRDVRDWDELSGIDPALLERVLGEEDRAWLNQWQNMSAQLESSGLVKKTRGGYQLSPRAIRKIGEKALGDIFRALNKDQAGQHEIQHSGGGGEAVESTRPWEFGAPFLLDLPRTVMNGVRRNGAGSPVSLTPEDFEIYETEYRTRTATVLMIDMSRSMLHNGCWDGAKKAAIALDTLIRGKYPHDMLEIVGFSSMAQRLQVTDLPLLEWNEYNYGTNLQHGLELARTLLRRERTGNRQVIVITDGEPTAHMVNGEVQFHYPPTAETFEATLREVVRCTKENITINTFMLERTPYMARFIDDLMRINRGRVIAASPDRLGSYVLTDYLSHRREQRSA